MQNPEHVLRLHADGIVGIPGAVSPSWAAATLEDFFAIYAEQEAVPGGTVSRGRNRKYLAVHPERLRGFIELATHPVVVSMCEQVLGDDWEICEVGFDVPFPDSRDQPWHRDFPTPDETRNDRVLTSLAFNLSTVDVTPEMGPFEIAPGTHFDDGDDWPHGMFPVDTARYDELGVRRMPRAGDMSVRTGLTVHRGTANRSQTARPVLILGAVMPSVVTAPEHEIVVTRGYYDALPEAVRRHLRVTSIVDRLDPIVQSHTIEGLVMGEEPTGAPV